MPKITQITPQKRKGIFNIYIDGQFAFGLDAENLVKEKLSEGLNLTDEGVERLQELSLYSKLLNTSLNFLSFRPRSKKEIEQNLDKKIYKILGSKDKSLSSKMKIQVVYKLESLKLVNDQDFARWWLEQRTKGGKGSRGPILIKRELYAKGVNRETIETVLKDSGRQVPSEALVALLTKKDRGLVKEPAQKRKQKLLELLLRRGFDFEVARASVADYLKRE